MNRIMENTMFWLARKMPRSLRYYATIVSGVEASTGVYSDTVVPEMKFVDALDRVLAKR